MNNAPILKEKSLIIENNNLAFHGAVFSPSNNILKGSWQYLRLDAAEI